MVVQPGLSATRDDFRYPSAEFPVQLTLRPGPRQFRIQTLHAFRAYPMAQPVRGIAAPVVLLAVPQPALLPDGSASAADGNDARHVALLGLHTQFDIRAGFWFHIGRISVGIKRPWGILRPARDTTVANRVGWGPKLRKPEEGQIPVKPAHSHVQIPRGPVIRFHLKTDSPRGGAYGVIMRYIPGGWAHE